MLLDVEKAYLSLQLKSNIVNEYLKLRSYKEL